MSNHNRNFLAFGGFLNGIGRSYGLQPHQYPHRGYQNMVAPRYRPTMITLYDVFGSSVEVKEEKANSRKSRVNGNGRYLYHQTDSSAADSIVQSGSMRRGSSGLAGGGIYFATSPEHTDHKARSKGVVLKCYVKLGNTKTISKHGNSSLTFSKLLKDGYDSVCIPRDNGSEYVVYNSDQVTNISYYRR